MASSFAAPQLIVTANDDVLNRRILEKARAIGRGFSEEFQDQMRLLVKAVVDIPPPASGKANRGAVEQGRAAIRSDLFAMGFVPVDIKGHRTIPKAFGRPIKPVPVVTHENPKFADPDAFHAARLASVAARRATRRGQFARVSRGGKQAFYVARAKYAAMVSRLNAEIGTLAAGWCGIAARMNLSLPAWITRHAGKTPASFNVNFDPNAGNGRMFIYAAIHAPGTVADSLISDTQRRIEAAKGYRANAIVRGLEGRAKRIAAER